jgi:plastocyanin
MQFNKRLFLIVFILWAAFGISSTEKAHAAVISGKAAFLGTAPASEKIKVDSDPNCRLLHPNGLTTDSVIVNPNGTLKNVFVYVKEGLAGKTFEAPKTPVTFDQKGCQYSPKVFGIQVNQPLEIINSDNTLHNVHALSSSSPQFNIGMPIQGMKIKKTFSKPEVMVKIKCEVHPWMSAYAGVVEHPFYAVSGEDGSFTIQNLPPGQYTLEAWHEKYGVQTQTVTIQSDTDTPTADFQYKSA